jgi:class 3 adenylate cyclase
VSEAGNVQRLVAAVLQAAQREMTIGNYERAAALANEVLEVVPDDAAALELLATVESQGQAGEQGRRFLTVLFSDLVGSTPLSEQLDPEDYYAVIDTYRRVVREVITRHEGHIDQFQGDGVVAYFGYPVAGEDDQVRAVEAGLDIVRSVPAAGRACGVAVASRVGVHVGRTVMTSSSLGTRDQNAAIGFVTNVAARIQAIAEPGGVVVSSQVVDAIAPYFALTPVGPRHLRGISEEMEVFTVAEPLARSTMADRRFATEMAGRHAERARVDRAWQAVHDGEGTPTVVITGEAGIGKSRLARYALDEARRGGAQLIEINCGRGFRHVGLGAIRRGIEKALRLRAAPTPDRVREAVLARGAALGLSEPAQEALVALLDESTDRPLPELTPDRLREAMIDALLEWVTAETTQGPVALLVEDLQWAGDTAVEVLRRLTSRPLPARLFLIITVRSDDMPRPLARLLDDAIELGPLDDTEAREMVRTLARSETLSDEDVATLARRGEGVPLFTEHLVMATAVAPGSPSAEPLPATLEGLLQVRLDATGPGRCFAEIAATVGREFTMDLVERVLVELGDEAPLSVAALPGALRTLRRAGLVESEDARTERFRHALVRDVAYEMQLRVERPRRHRAVARAFAAVHGPDAPPETLAYHLERAGEPLPAATAYLRAAEMSSNRAEFDVSLDQLAAAKRIIETLEGPMAYRLELAHCMQFGTVSTASFSYTGEEAERAFLRALEVCDLLAPDEGGDRALDVQLLSALGGLWSKEVVTGDLAAAAAVTDRLERLLEGAPPDLQPQILRFVLACRGFEQLFAGQTRLAIATLTEASSADTGPATVPLGTPHDYVVATDALLAAGLALADDDAGADVALARALERAASLPFPIGPFSEAVVQVYAAYVHRIRGDAEAARAAAQIVSEIGERHGFREHAMLGQILLLAASVLERDANACEALESVLGMWRAAGGGLAVPVLLTELAEGWLALGDTERARAALDDARTTMDASGQHGPEPDVIRLAAVLDARAGAAPDNVLRQLERAAELAEENGSLRLAARARAEIERRVNASA